MTTNGTSKELNNDNPYIKPKSDHFIFNSALNVSLTENIPVFCGASYLEKSEALPINYLCPSAVVLGANVNANADYADVIFFKKGSENALGGTFKANCMWLGWLRTMSYTDAGLCLLNSILYFVVDKTSILNGSVQSSSGDGLSRDVYFYQKPKMTAYKTRSDGLGQFSIELPRGQEYVGISFDDGNKNAVTIDKIIL